MDPTTGSSPRSALRRTRYMFSAVAAAIAMAAGPGGRAQEARAPASSADDASLIVLSPFVVEADANDGYLATSTLAGTRLNSRIRDLAAAVTIATPQFLADTGATNTEDLLIYMPGSETGGPGGNYSSLQPANNEGTLIVQGQLSAFGGATRSRGLAEFDNTRDYFLSAIPLDTYNSDGVVINRGPNSILFGLGSPAGIINNQLKKAAFSDQNTVRLTSSSFGSTRETVDLNKEIMENKLAIRLIALNDHRSFQQKPAFKDDQRVYGAVTYQDRLFKNSSWLNRTSLRGNFESGKIEANNPWIAPPVDEISNWFRLGKPSWNVVDGVWQTKTASVIDVTRPGLLRNLTAVYRDPTSSTADAGYAGVTAGARQFVADSVTTPGGSVRSPMVLATTTRTGFSMTLAGDPMGRFTSSPSLIDRSVFDYRNNKLSGDYDREKGDFTAYGLTFEQLFFADQSLGLELAYDRQSFNKQSRQLASSIDATLQVDINEVLMNGEPNPDYGRIFFTSFPYNSSSRQHSESMRATMFYKFNFAEKFSNSWLKHLGRHIVTGLLNRQDSDYWYAGGFTYTSSSSDYNTTYGGSANDYLAIGRGPWTDIHYVGPSILGANSLADVSGVQRLTAIQTPAGGMSSYVWNKTTGQFENKTFTYLKNSDDGSYLSSGITFNRQVIDTMAGTAQSFFFNDKLVSTLGWRQDKVKIYDAGDNFNADFRSDPLTPRDAMTGLIIPSNYFLPDRPGFTTKQSVFSWGVVAHTPDWLEKRMPWGSSLSLHAQDSENFQPTGARYDSLLNELGPVRGSTKEYGFTFSMFDEKFVARVNWYKTNQENVGISVPTLGNVMGLAALSVRENTPEELAAAGFQMPSQKLKDFYNWTQSSTPNSNGGYDVQLTPSGTVTEVTSYEAKGTEIELIYNATRNWRMMFNATREQSVRTGSGAALAQVIQQMLPQWGDGDGADDPGELIYTNTTRTLTLQQDAQRNIIDPFRAFYLQDGGPARELRKWRWNAISTYSFGKGSLLSGFRVGGAMRWQDKVAIGYPVEYNADVKDYIPVVSKPYMGPTDFKVDMWIGYSLKLTKSVDVDLQLNVKNVGNVGLLVPAAANPDGKVAGYWIGEGRTYDLTATFKF
jgi:hypothetical protein